MQLIRHDRLFVKQAHELGEWIGFETRNKYRIVTESGLAVGFAVEQQKGALGFLLRQALGHWRPFEIRFFDEQRNLLLVATHPFRFFFQRLEIATPDGRRLGALQQRFGLLSKKFDVLSETGETLMEVRSPFWRIWTFPFVRQGVEVATVAKKWSGALSEIFTDRDNFLVEFKDSELREEERGLVLAAALFIDLQYFEKKGG